MFIENLILPALTYKVMKKCEHPYGSTDTFHMLTIPIHTFLVYHIHN